MKLDKEHVQCYLREDLESILLRFEHGDLVLSETLELIAGDVSDQIEVLVEVINSLVTEVKGVIDNGR